MVRIHPDPPSCRGCSSVGRAPALQAGGRRFDPVQLHHGRVAGNRGQGSGIRDQKKAEASRMAYLWLFGQKISVVL